jgi:large subunit ribosomal protein L29
MTYVDLLEKSSEDLGELKSSLIRDLFSYKMKNAVGQLENTSLPGKMRKDLARIEQILTERSRAPEGSTSEGVKA